MDNKCDFCGKESDKFEQIIDDKACPECTTKWIDMCKKFVIENLITSCLAIQNAPKRLDAGTQIVTLTITRNQLKELNAAILLAKDLQRGKIPV